MKPRYQRERSGPPRWPRWQFLGGCPRLAQSMAEAVAADDMQAADSRKSQLARLLAAARACQTCYLRKPSVLWTRAAEKWYGSGAALTCAYCHVAASVPGRSKAEQRWHSLQMRLHKSCTDAFTLIECQMEEDAGHRRKVQAGERRKVRRRLPHVPSCTLRRWRQAILELKPARRVSRRGRGVKDAAASSTLSRCLRPVPPSWAVSRPSRAAALGV